MKMARRYSPAPRIAFSRGVWSAPKAGFEFSRRPETPSKKSHSALSIAEKDRESEPDGGLSCKPRAMLPKIDIPAISRLGFLLNSTSSFCSRSWNSWTSTACEVPSRRLELNFWKEVTMSW